MSKLIRVVNRQLTQKDPFLTANEEKIDQDGAYQVVSSWKDVGNETRIDGKKEDLRQQVKASDNWMQANSKRSWIAKTEDQGGRNGGVEMVP